MGKPGVGGVKAIPFLRPAVVEVGVIGNVFVVEFRGELRRAALAMGRKMPAPGTMVAKYDTLWKCDAHVSLVRGATESEKRLGCIPIHIAAVLPPRCEVRVQLHASKCALLALDVAKEAYRSMHAAGHVDSVANDNVLGGGPARRHRSHIARSRVAHDGVEGVAFADIGDAGEGAGRQGGERGLARQAGRHESRLGGVDGAEIGRGRGGDGSAQRSREGGPSVVYGGGCCCCRGGWSHGVEALARWRLR